MKLKKGDLVSLDIEDIAFGGKGVGRHEGLVVFVDGVMRGERVEACFQSFKKGFATAKLLRVLRPARNRLKPRCEYFEKCGGCSYQYLAYDEQLALKNNQVASIFERIGKLANARDLQEEILPCAEEFYYRNKMEFSFGYDAEMNFALGMHIPNRKFDILDLKNCYLQSPETMILVNLVRDFVHKKGWLPFRYSDGRGFVKHLIIREGKKTGQRMLILVTADVDEASGGTPEFFEENLNTLAQILEKSELVNSFYHSVTISRRGIPRETKDYLIFGQEVLEETMSLTGSDKQTVLKFKIRPRAFFQVNTKQAEKLYNLILEYAKVSENDLVFDFFCGTGTIGIALALKAGNVVGVELNAEALATAKQNASQNKVRNIQFVCANVKEAVTENGRLSAILAKESLKKPNIIVIDPPRAGLSKEMLQGVCEFRAKRIVYVACDPATQARDCEMMQRFYGYKVRKMRAVDMFPQTNHIENIVLLELD